MRLGPWAGWMNGWWAAVATVGLACLGVCHRAQGQPLPEPLYVSIDASLSLPPEELRAAIATELGIEANDVREAAASDVAGALIQVAAQSETQIRVIYRDVAGTTRERTVEKKHRRQQQSTYRDMVSWQFGAQPRGCAGFSQRAGCCCCSRGLAKKENAYEAVS